MSHLNETNNSRLRFKYWQTRKLVNKNNPMTS